MLRYAVLYGDEKVFVAIDEPIFRQLLVEYGGEQAGEALDKAHKDLELEARRK